MKEYHVGLLGAVINNENMGCVALTYSLLHLLENISQEQECVFTYYIFEDVANEDRLRLAAKRLSIDFQRLRSRPVVYLFGYRRMMHHPVSVLKVLRGIYKCDFFIDLTSGDSFTDIYGQKRFDEHTDIKELVKWKMKKPLILGPETYGPFNNEKNRIRASKLIEKADCVIARDQISAEYIQEYSVKKQVFVTTDMAFGLPFTVQDSHVDKIRIGINVSSLLVKEKTEETEIHFTLKTDYDLYMKALISNLLSDSRYEIHIIPHVGRDAGNELKKEFPSLVYVDAFEDPVSAKNYISMMDIFIGARMHATVAAFSSGVATIPVAYSRKFTGLYQTLDYPYVIDMTKLETTKAIETTISYIKHYRDLKESAKVGLEIAREKNEQTYKIMRSCIQKIIFS